MNKITTTIKRDWLKKIANRTKRVEYREIKPYWVKRLSHAPEITGMVTKVGKNSRSQTFALVLGKIVELKHWSVRSERPTPRN